MKLSSKAVANFYLNRAGALQADALSPMKLQKLVYFAHGWYLGLTGNPLIKETVEAWPYGPVIPELYHEFKIYGNDKITTYATDATWATDSALADVELIVPEVPNDGSTESVYTLALLERIWDVYKHFTAIELSTMTHEPKSPWDRVREQYGGLIPKSTAIPNEWIREFFAGQAVRNKLPA